MNQVQRNYLIEQIQKTARIKRVALEDQLEDAPSLSMYLYKAVMSDEFELRGMKELREYIKEKALTLKDRDDWLGNHWGSSSKSDVVIPANKFFIIPNTHKERDSKISEANDEINEKIRILNVEEETLIMRIQLASNKTLETMISEVDDMGNLSLMDTKLKQLTS